MLDSRSDDRNDCHIPAGRTKALKSAAYVGRVGGLAVALGIGIAIAGGQAMAHADTAGETSKPTSNDAAPSDPDQPDGGSHAQPGGQLDPQPRVTSSDKKHFESPFRPRRILAVLGISPRKGDNSIVGSRPTDPAAASKSRRVDDPSGRRAKRDEERRGLTVAKADEPTNASVGTSEARRLTLQTARPQIDIKPARVFTPPSSQHVDRRDRCGAHVRSADTARPSATPTERDREARRHQLGRLHCA